MDHKWGRDITTYGVGDLGATVCSRFPGGSVTVVLLNVRVSPTKCLQAVISSDMNNPMQIQERIHNRPDLNFPFGLAVEADAPV